MVLELVQQLQIKITNTFNNNEIKKFTIHFHFLYFVSANANASQP